MGIFINQDCHVASLLAMTIKFPLQRFTVYGNSMLPTLKPGRDVLVWCWFINPKVGDLVAIKVNGKEMVKRVRQISSDRRIFVEGDNKKMSTDSRKFGWIDRKNLLGKVIDVF